MDALHQQLPEQFVTIACLCYDDPRYDHRSFHVRAQEMLEKNRWLTGADIWSAATAGDVGAVKAFIEEDPDLVNRPGPHGWTPLLCACYSRVRPIDPRHSTFEVAKVLLDHGADPDTFIWKHNDPPGSDRARRFTALSGLFGGGSMGPANQPPHPRWLELAELLLERGADPADEMALAINQDACLELLLRYGLKPNAMTRGGITLMGRTLCQAARRGKLDQVRLLLAHGARADEKFDGRIAWEHAMKFGHLDVARMLEETGAAVAELGETETFVSLCMVGDERGARAMLELNPELMEQAPKALVHRAVATKRIEAVKLVLDLGFDPNFQEDNAAIHETGPLAEDEKIRRLLLDRGASLTLRDPWYDSTGVGWADFFDCRELRDKYLADGPICLLDALEFKRFDRVPDVLARDPDALERPFAKCISREPKPEDWQTPLVRMVDQGNIDAVRVLLEHGADVSARHPDGRSVVELARDKGFREIAELLER